jgi:deazaflavin-dependent oxidoreductase (nitroreductase family)
MPGWNEHIIDEFRSKEGKGVGPFGDHLLLLTTQGAKSGTKHTTPLAFHRDGDRIVVVASKGGAPKHPDWYFNIVAHPDVEIELGTENGIEKFAVHATPVPSGPERDRLYAQQATMMPGFWEYEKKTTRKIPAVVLEKQPAAVPAAA